MLHGNQQIIQNSLYMYLRMGMMTIISLYTSRIVLEQLGVIDYGIYNVVGCIVSMFNFINGAMTNAVQRYLSFEIGKKNFKQANHIFCVAFISHCIIAVLITIIIEAIGPWFIITYMTIPAERIEAAHWVLQCSIFTTIFSIIQVPYNAILISKERMKIYAYFSIIEAILKLIIVYMLLIENLDKLKLYAVLQMIVTIGILISYRIYCTCKFHEAKFHFVRDKKTLKELTNFACWNVLEELAWGLTSQGVNIIINIFCGPSVNAARGLANQVNVIVNRFVQNFQIAVNPQLIKMYATGQITEMKTLLFRSSRFSYYLLFLLSLPLICEMQFILNFWLYKVPEYTIRFCQLVLIGSLVNTFSKLLAQVARAYGKIHKHQLCISSVLTLNFILSYISLRLGYSPIMTYIIAISIQTINLIIRLYFIKSIINFSIKKFLQKVILPCMKVSFLSMIMPIIFIHVVNEGIIRFCFSCLISLIAVTCTTYIIGMDTNEHNYIKKQIRTILQKCIYLHK